MSLRESSDGDAPGSQFPRSPVSAREIERWIMSRIAEFTGEQEGTYGPDTNFADIGLSSREAVVLAGELQGFIAPTRPEIARTIQETAAWNFPSARSLALHLTGAEHPAVAIEHRPTDTTHRIAIPPVAVIGTACRFPGAPGTDAFWSLLVSGRDGLEDHGGRRARRPHGFLSGIDQFDAALFGLSDLEAPYVDPQQRLMLEVAWEALEDAAIAPTGLAGSRTGVFVGICGSDYGRLQLAEPELRTRFSGTGQALSIAANRLSYLLDLRGASLAVDTACSSSLVAVHLAVQSLRTGESDLALAGGVSVLLGSEMTEIFAEAGMMAPDGRCKAFDAEADGYVRSEGCGLVVLKRLPDAVAHGDRVLGVITGSAVVQDGRTNGLTAPNGLAQQAVLRHALHDARTEPGDISYVEAHGTGTVLGDQIELGALCAVFGETRNVASPLLVGSAKAHIGHAEAAAGIAGLIKVLLMMQHRKVPGQIHLRRLNPQLSADAPISVARASLDWQAVPGRPLTAGVSSFGFGGTNSHVIVQEPLVSSSAQDAVSPRPCHLIAVSANTETALATLAGRYAQWLRGHPDADLGAFSRTTTLGRAHLYHRAALVASGHDDAVAGLESLTGAPAAAEPSDTVHRGRTGGVDGRLAMLFSGGGSQYLDMGRQLYVTNALFRDHLDRCQELLADHLDVPLLSVLFPPPSHRHLLDRIRYMQPAMVALGYALAQVWRAWGVVADLVLGHSTGEFAAACVAGAIDLADGLRLAAERGRLIEELCEPGSMAVVFADEEFVRAAAAGLPGDRVPTVAAVNAPDSVVVAGRPEDLARFVAKLSEQGVASRPMKLGHAYHSPMMIPVQEPLARAARGLAVRDGAIGLVSDLDGRLFADDYRPDAAYWVRQLIEPVRFADGIRCLAEQGCSLFLEVGPGRSLVSAGQRVVPGAVWASSIRPDVDDWAALSDAAARLYAAGRDIDWEEFHRGNGHDRLVLPGYPFERRRYWLPRVHRATPVEAETGSVGDPARGTSSQEGQERQMPSNAPIPSPARGTVQPGPESTLAVLSRIVGTLLGQQSQVDPDRPFLELGADSMTLFQTLQTVRKTFGVSVPIGMLFAELNTLNRLAAYVRDSAPPEVLTQLTAQTPLPGVADHGGQGDARLASPGTDTAETIPAAPVPRSTLPGPADMRGVGQFLQVHAQVMRQAYELLRDGEIEGNEPEADGPAGASISQGPEPAAAAMGSETMAPARDPAGGRIAMAAPQTFIAFRAGVSAGGNGLTGAQAAFAQHLVRRYAARTRRSGELARAERQRHSDVRHAMQAFPDLEQIRYPLTVDRSVGSRLWDLDGNEYIDLTMGFGVNLFGHQDPFIVSAITEQLSRGMQLGPHSPLAAEVAQMICDMTSQQRIVYCNTGSEAVMVAVRLARAVTGRRRIALFAGAYHGSADPILARQDVERGSGESVPMAPGITEDISRNALVLPYGTDDSLDVLRAHQGQLAAVLVEPVQSRQPDLQPVRFLGQLRELTRAAGIPLIFDEIVTGFRVHPGGVQALFGVKADITTYGKVLGGGLPIGVVAGDARYLDAIDGGSWRSDGRHRESVRTFFTGTFAKHPLALAAARAVLSELKRRGPGLQENLNARTAILAQRLNAVLAAEGIAARVAQFGSLFRFNFPNEPPLSRTVELFHTALLEKGLYIWEGRNCFLSTAHTDADLEEVVSAVARTAAEMSEAGFSLGGVTRAVAAHEAAGPASPAVAVAAKRDISAAPAGGRPLSRVQQEMWLLGQFGKKNPRVSPVSALLDIRGELEVETLRAAVAAVVERHDSLHSVIAADGSTQNVVPPQVDLPVIDFASVTDEERSRRLTAWFEARAEEVLDLTARPPVRTALLRLTADHHQLYLSVHHAMIDGWSFDVILPEIVELYDGRRTGKSVTLPEPVQYWEHVAWEREREQDPAREADAEYWREQFADRLPELILPTDRPRSAATGYRVDTVRREIDRDTARRLPGTAGRLGVTPFTVLLAAYGYLLHQLSGQEDVVIAVPFARRSYPGGERVVGNCSTTLPVRSRFRPGSRVQEYIHALHATLVAGHEHSDFSIGALRKRIRVGDGEGGRIFATGFNLDYMSTLRCPAGLQISIASVPRRHDQTDLALDLLQVGEDLRLTICYNEDLFEPGTADQYACVFDHVLRQFVADPDAPLDSVKLAPPESLVQMRGPGSGPTMAAAGASTLPALVERQVSQSPEAIVLWHEDHKLSYADLNARANRLARHLVELGAGPERVVSLAIPASIPLVVGMLAALKAGAACNLLDTEQSPALRGRVLAEAGPSIVMTLRGTSGLAGSRGAAHVILDDPATADRIGDRDDADLTDRDRRRPLLPDHPAFVCYTASSAGQIKGVVIPHASIVNTVQWWCDEIPLTGEHRTLITAPMTSSPSVHGLFWSLAAGAAVVLPAHDQYLDRDYLAALIQCTATTSAQFLPAALRGFLRAPAVASRTGLQRVLCGGEPLSADLFDSVREVMDVDLVDVYSPDEASSWPTTRRSRQRPPGTEATIERSAWNTTVCVLDRHLHPVPPGFIGDLYIAGAGLARGYLRRPALTAERFLPVPSGVGGERMYRTAYMARWSGDGQLRLVGRTDVEQKVPEVQAEQGAIEAALRMLPI